MRSEKHINKFLESLDNKLKENGINNFIYSLGKKEEDTTCLKFEQDKWLVEKEEEKIICDKIEQASKIFASEISFSDEEKNVICSTISDEYKKVAELSHFSVIEIYNFCYENIMESIYKVGYIRTLKVYLNLFQRSILKEINDELTTDSLNVDIKYNEIIVKYYNSVSKLIAMLKDKILDKDYGTKIMISLLVLYNSFIEDKEKYYKLRNEVSLNNKEDIDYNFYDCSKYLSKSFRR